MEKELICVRQLPVIEEQLRRVKTEIDDKVEKALSLVCTADTVQTVKKVRAAMNSELSQWEKKRLDVKKEIMAPYERFETVYKEYVQDAYKRADNMLGDKIRDVENELKSEKSAKIKSYFNEYAQHNNIDFVTFENSGINVTLSASEKKLKEQAKAYIDKICEDLDIIDAQPEYAEEIRVEYKNGQTLSTAITVVINRHRMMEQEMHKKAQTCSEQEPVQTALKAPDVVDADKNIYKMSFTVYATRDQLRGIKKYLVDNGIKIEGSNE